MIALGRSSSGGIVVSAVALAVLGGFFLNSLVVDWQNNAYAGLILIGVALFVLSVVVVLGAMLRSLRARRITLRTGLALLWIVGALSVVYLVLSLLTFYGQRIQGQVVHSHVLGLVALVVLFPFIHLLVWRSRS